MVWRGQRALFFLSCKSVLGYLSNLRLIKIKHRGDCVCLCQIIHIILVCERCSLVFYRDKSFLTFFFQCINRHMVRSDPIDILYSCTSVSLGNPFLDPLWILKLSDELIHRSCPTGPVSLTRGVFWLCPEVFFKLEVHNSLKCLSDIPGGFTKRLGLERGNSSGCVGEILHHRFVTFDESNL